MTYVLRRAGAGVKRNTNGTANDANVANVQGADLKEHTNGIRQTCIYLTRSDVSWYSRNANAYQKPLVLSQVFDLTVIQPEGVTLPSEIAQRCRIERIPCGDVSRRWTVGRVLRFMVGCARRLSKLMPCHRSSSGRGYKRTSDAVIATGFDIPCLLLGWWLKRRWGLKWFVFCWDPPALSWRDRRDVFGRMIVAVVDSLFRRTVRHADRLILNIHSGVLDEFGYQPHSGQLIRMVNGVMPRPVCVEGPVGSGDSWRIGVLSNASSAKGFTLVLEAFISLARDMSQLKLVWIGDVSDKLRTALANRLERESILEERFIVTGKLDQAEAFLKLAECGILLHPYLAVPSLKWNYPLKLVEYMSLGRAIVATDLPGVRAYLTSEVNGLLFAAGDERDLCRTLGRLVGNEAEQARLGRQAISDAAQFEWPKLNQELAVKLYEGCAHGSGEDTLL